MAEFLLELFSEEIPAGMQEQAASGLGARLQAELAAAGLACGRMRTFAGPRRLTAVADGLPLRQPDLREERRGPKTGAPQTAIDGFLRAAGLPGLEACERRMTPKGEFWFAVIEQGGLPVPQVLPGVIARAVTQFPWPKSMRFASQAFQWVRPLRRVNAVFDGRPLTGQLELPGAVFTFGAETAGHRFMAPEPFTFHDFQSYASGLRARKVMLDGPERQAAAAAGLRAAAAKQGLTVKADPALLGEVAGLVEWPVVLLGRIDGRFMALPPAVLESVMRGHQKYFSLLDAAGAPAPFFGLVANMETADGGAAIIAGNERVLRARLADAEFFRSQDMKQPLEAWLPALSRMVFHLRLGTVADRVARIRDLAARLAAAIPGADPAQVDRAAQLAKADLASRMVGEFPELQGQTGRDYALARGEPAAVADAIAEHYAPLGPGDRCPAAPVSVAVALAEKLDTLCGFWLIDEKPTGSRDPFALRRAALGVIRLILENGLRLPLKPALVRHIRESFPVTQRDGRWLFGADNPAPLDAGPEDIAESLLGFIADRLKAHLKSEGVRHDHIQAVFAGGGTDDLTPLLARIRALTGFLDSAAGDDLLAAGRRAGNILKAEEKRGAPAADDGGAPDPALFTEPAETGLWRALQDAERQVRDALGREDYNAALAALAELRAPLDAFFDQVTVNAGQAPLRRNRLLILASVRGVMGHIADFGCIEARRETA